MFEKKRWLLSLCPIIAFTPAGFHIGSTAEGTPRPEIVFDHISAYQEVVDYLDEVLEYYLTLTESHTIVQSCLGKDLLVLEITNRGTCKGGSKSGYLIDGNPVSEVESRAVAGFLLSRPNEVQVFKIHGMSPATPVTVSISLENASPDGGKESVDLGHIDARSSIEAEQWLVKVFGSGMKAAIEVVSQQGGPTLNQFT